MVGLCLGSGKGQAYFILLYRPEQIATNHRPVVQRRILVRNESRMRQYGGRREKGAVFQQISHMLENASLGNWLTESANYKSIVARAVDAPYLVRYPKANTEWSQPPEGRGRKMSATTTTVRAFQSNCQDKLR